jgi:Holliday junction resolvase RusA-like endonuclease
MAQQAKPILGQVIIDIELNSPYKRPYDPDNRVKAVMDLLVKNDIIQDDSNKIIKRFTVTTDVDGFEGARITISVA